MVGGQTRTLRKISLLLLLLLLSGIEHLSITSSEAGLGFSRAFLFVRRLFSADLSVPYGTPSLAAKARTQHHRSGGAQSDIWHMISAQGRSADGLRNEQMNAHLFWPLRDPAPGCMGSNVQVPD